MVSLSGFVTRVILALLWKLFWTVGPSIEHIPPKGFMFSWEPRARALLLAPMWACVYGVYMGRLHGGSFTRAGRMLGRSQNMASLPWAMLLLS